MSTPTHYYAARPTELRLSVSAVILRAVDMRTVVTQELLLMQRSDNGHWGLPGGYVDVGESIVQALRREVREETGASVEPGRLVGVYSEPARQTIAYPDGNRVQAVNLCFAARVVEEGAEPTTPEETLATGWFDVDALPRPLVPIHFVRIQDAVAGLAGARVR